MRSFSPLDRKNLLSLYAFRTPERATADRNLPTIASGLSPSRRTTYAIRDTSFEILLAELARIVSHEHKISNKRDTPSRSRMYYGFHRKSGLRAASASSSRVFAVLCGASSNRLGSSWISMGSDGFLNVFSKNECLLNVL